MNIIPTLSTNTTHPESLRTYHKHLSSHLINLLRSVDPTLPLAPQNPIRNPANLLSERSSTINSADSGLTKISSVSSSADSAQESNVKQVLPGLLVDSGSSIEEAGTGFSLSSQLNKEKISLESTKEDVPVDKASHALPMKEEREEVLEEPDQKFPIQDRTARPEYSSHSSNLISHELVLNAVKPTISITSSPLLDVEITETSSNGPTQSVTGKTIVTSLSAVEADHSSLSGTGEVDMTLSREEEHARAWEADGRRVWRNLPKGFQLSLSDNDRCRRRSHESLRLRERDDTGFGIVGLGIRSASIRAKEIEQGEEEKFMEPVFTPPARYSARIEIVSSKTAADLDRAGDVEITPQAHSSTAVPTMMYHSITESPTRRPSKGTPKLGTSGDLSPQSHIEPLPKESTQVTKSSTPKPTAFPIPESSANVSRRKSSEGQKVEVEAEYEQRRLAKLRRHEGQLKVRVGKWLQGLGSDIADWDIHTPPAIYPNIPSPSIATTLLRFPPLPAGFPPPDSSKSYNLLSNRPKIQSLAYQNSSTTVASDFFQLPAIPDKRSKAESAAPAPVSGRAITLGTGTGGRLSDLDVEIAIRLQALKDLSLHHSSKPNSREVG